MQVSVDLIPVLRFLSSGQRKGLYNLLEGEGASKEDLDKSLLYYFGPYLKSNPIAADFHQLDAPWHRRAIRVRSAIAVIVVNTQIDSHV